MPEQIPLNNHLLNQVSREKIQEVKADLDPLSLYCLQLAKWALDSGEVTLDQRIPDLQEVPRLLEKLLYEASPQAAWRFLLENEDGEIEELLGREENPSPEELADRIVDQYISALQLKADLSLSQSYR